MSLAAGNRSIEFESYWAGLRMIRRGVMNRVGDLPPGMTRTEVYKAALTAIYNVFAPEVTYLKKMLERATSNSLHPQSAISDIHFILATQFSYPDSFPPAEPE